MTQATQLRRVQPATTPGARVRPVAIDPGRWPDVATVPRAGLNARIARRLLAMAAARLPIRVRPRGGREFGRGGPEAPVMVLHRPADFYRRLGASGLIGFGESYMAGDWDCDDLTSLLTIMCTRIDRMVPPALQWLRHVYVARPPAEWNADQEGSRRNVRQHYDLSNEMFALFLDETMTYSAALYASDRDGGPVAPCGELTSDDAAAQLTRAQHRKIDRLLDDARVGPGSRVLEIGTGWGELAIRAAARGAAVHSVTVSARQQALARQRIAGAGLAHLATVGLQDYREVTGQFDAIVSVEMIEAVAERYWPDYFRALDRLLAPGGRIGLQAITMEHRRMRATRRTKTWILKYIFPGGLIPSVPAIEENLRRQTRLHITGQHEFGLHYAQTLQIWQARFDAAAGRLSGLGFDEVFRRMWRLYLSYSEAGFRSRYLQVSQFILSRDDGSPA
jgi:cyclopropane-fatty-acyl-phospholipid synthase